MVNERIWNLLARKISGEASADELQELEKVLQADAELRKTIQSIDGFWATPAVEDDKASEEDWKDHLRLLKETSPDFHDIEDASFHIPINKKRFVSRQKWMAAAAVISILSISAWLVYRAGNTHTITRPVAKLNEISTKRGSKSKVQLPDGSTVWFNAGSKLNYTPDYGKNIREIEFSGEGYFDIVKMPDKPFIIHTKTIDIKVLGTAFNLRAYPTDKQTETSLIRGKIEVTVKNRPDKRMIILEPNEKLIVDNTVVTDTVSKVKSPGSSIVLINRLSYNPGDSTFDEVKWIDDVLVIKEKTFREMITELERWYNVEIEVNNKRLEDRVITVTLKDESIDTALEALSYYAHFKYEKNGNKIVIY